MYRAKWLIDWLKHTVRDKCVLMADMRAMLGQQPLLDAGGRAAMAPRKLIHQMEKE